jgi:hypothetical protein
MRRKTGILVLLYAAALLAARTAFGEAERTLRTDLPDAAATAFVVENLAGTLRVVAGSGDAAAIVATVHAENDAIADAVKLDRTSGAGGTVLHVRYPETQRSIRYPTEPGEGLDLNLFSWGEGHRYQEQTFRVSRHRGKLLYVDVEVRLPARLAGATFSQVVGRVEAQGVEGKLAFEVESADVKLDRVKGNISLKGTSGDIRASDVSGSWTSEFTSGDCALRGFRGEGFAFRSTSGDLNARDLEARHVRIQTTSGDVLLRDSDIEELETRSTSGDVDVDQKSTRLAQARLDATSGDVLIRLPGEASFEVDTNTGSGDVHIGYPEVVSERHGHDPSVYRHGTGGALIRIKTSSGNLTIRPR